MAIRYTKKTREILNFISEYGFITTNICSKVFYKGNKNGYSQSIVILNKLFKNGDLKRYQHENTKEWVYQMQSKLVDDHRKSMLDLYSSIFTLVDSILYFKIEENWAISKRRSDAHIIFSKDGVTNSFLVEYEKYHTTSNNKLKEIFNSGEVQEFYSKRFGADAYFPNVLVISPLGTTRLVSDDITIVCIAYDLKGLYELI